MAVRKIEIDTSRLERAAKGLAERLATQTKREAYNQALRTAEKTRGFVPVRTGALLATVGVTDVPGGYGVTYGSGARYHYVQNARKKIVKKGTRGSRADWYRTLQALAEQEVGRI